MKTNSRMNIAIILALVTEFLGGSLTGIIMIGFIVFYYFLGEKMLRLRKISPKLLFWISIGIFIFLMFFVSVGRYTAIISFLFNGNVTFSNRLRIWNAGMDIIRKSPLFGIGSQSTETLVRYIYNVHAHNHFLEIGIRSGIIGLFIYVYIIWIAVKKLSDYKQQKSISFLTMCLFVSIIINMMEVETYSYAIISYITAIIYCWLYPKKREKV